MMSQAMQELDRILEVGSIIGEGTFSTVYNGTLLPEYAAVEGAPKRLAVKCITPIVDPQTLENELKCLTLLEGKYNVVQLLFASRTDDKVVLVMPYFQHEKFGRLIRRFRSSHVRDYMRQLLLAANHIHSYHIIHRDIKPNNFLYSTKTTQCALVDFGLAQLVTPTEAECPQISDEGRLPLEDLTTCLSNVSTRTSLCDGPKKRKSDEPIRRRCNCRGHASVCKLCIGTPAITASRAGTAGYRPPEVLLKCVEQTTAVDMWACGVILLSILSGKTNFFNAPDDLTSLLQLVTLFGKEAVCSAAAIMGKHLLVDVAEGGKSSSLKEICVTMRQSAKSRGMKCSKKEVVTFPDAAYDLLERLLKLTPGDRITATEALQHPFISSDC